MTRDPDCSAVWILIPKPEHVDLVIHHLKEFAKKVEENEPDTIEFKCSKCTFFSWETPPEEFWVSVETRSPEALEFHMNTKYPQSLVYGAHEHRVRYGNTPPYRVVLKPPIVGFERDFEEREREREGDHVEGETEEEREERLDKRDDELEEIEEENWILRMRRQERRDRKLARKRGEGGGDGSGDDSDESLSGEDSETDERSEGSAGEDGNESTDPSVEAMDDDIQEEKNDQGREGDRVIHEAGTRRQRKSPVVEDDQKEKIGIPELISKVSNTEL